MRVFIFLFVIALTPMDSDAHGGGLNADGCHNNRSNDTYHCHDGSGGSGGLGGLLFLITGLLIYFIYTCFEHKESNSNNKKKPQIKKEKHLKKINDQPNNANKNKDKDGHSLSKPNDYYLQDLVKIRRAKAEKHKRNTETRENNQLGGNTENKKVTENLLKNVIKSTGLDIETLAIFIKCYIEVIKKERKKDQNHHLSKKDHDKE